MYKYLPHFVKLYLWNKGKQWLVLGLQAVDQRVKT